MAGVSSPRSRAASQRNARKARAKFQDTFESPEAKTAYFSALGARANERRLVLSGDEVAALSDAYALLAGIAARAQAKHAQQSAANGHAPNNPEEATEE